jgi:hypothetical protein
MTVGTPILAISGAAEERKSHEAMSAAMSRMDPNEAVKALKKFTASPPSSLGVSDRVKRGPPERNLAIRAQVEANDVDGMRAMIEREVAGQQDDDLRIETSNFDAHGYRLSAPVEFTIGIQAEPDVAPRTREDRQSRSRSASGRS